MQEITYQDAHDWIVKYVLPAMNRAELRAGVISSTAKKRGFLRQLAACVNELSKAPNGETYEWLDQPGDSKETWVLNTICREAQQILIQMREEANQ